MSCVMTQIVRLLYNKGIGVSTNVMPVYITKQKWESM